MEPICIRVSQIIDLGPVLSIVGIDVGSNKFVAVHIDHRAFQAICETWNAVGIAEKNVFTPEGYTLTLDIKCNGEDLVFDDSDDDDTAH